MSDPITPATIATIARLRELDAAATPVPWAADEWYCSDSEGGWAAIGPHHHAETDNVDDGPDGSLHEAAKADAALIAAMRNAFPALLDQLDAQAAEIERLNKGFHESCIAREEAANARAKKAEARVAELERELALSAQRNAALLSDKDAVGAVLRTDSSLAELRGRAERLEGLLRKHSALACSTCMGTGAYLGDEDRDGPCDACGGTGAVLPEEVADVLAEREGGR